MTYLSDRHMALLSAALGVYREKCENDAAINQEAGRERAAQELLRTVVQCDELTARLADSRVAIYPASDTPDEPLKPIEFDRGGF